MMKKQTNRLPALAIFLLIIGLSSQAVGQDPETINGTPRDPYRVVTYNIKRGLGNDNQTDLSRSASVLQSLKPDFVGIQEVDDRTERSGGVDQASMLGKRLRMHHAFAPFMDFEGGQYGLAILSKHPIANVEVVKLPTGNEPRVAIVAEIQLPGRNVKLVNVHFDWVADDSFRYSQAKRLRGYLDTLTMPYILLGDFNDQPNSRTLELLGKGAVEAKKPSDDRFTYSSDDPRMEIDFVFAFPRSRWEFRNVRVVDEPLASDHRPVFAELYAR